MMIETLCNRMREEMDDCSYYAEKALWYQDKYPEIAKAFRLLSEQEHGHALVIYDAAKRCIGEEEWEAKLLEYEKEVVDERAAKVKEIWAKIR